MRTREGIQVRIIGNEVRRMGRGEQDQRATREFLERGSSVGVSSKSGE